MAGATSLLWLGTGATHGCRAPAAKTSGPAPPPAKPGPRLPPLGRPIPGRSLLTPPPSPGPPSRCPRWRALRATTRGCGCPGFHPSAGGHYTRPGRRCKAPQSRPTACGPHMGAPSAGPGVGVPGMRRWVRQTAWPAAGAKGGPQPADLDTPARLAGRPRPAPGTACCAATSTCRQATPAPAAT